MPESPILFKNQTSDALYARLSPLGVSARLARRLQAAVLRQDALPVELPETSTRLLAELRVRTQVPHLKLQRREVSPQDGFVKYLFRGAGEDPFESVAIPLLHHADAAKYVACVSSQVGCAMGCAFCATGRMGFRRNLEPWEMVDQVIQIQARAPHPVRGVVFMGMGEPLLNYDAVIMAARILSEPCGLAIAAKAITLSTVGIVPAIRRFTAERQPYRLVVSLTSADPHVRVALLPVEQIHPTTELLAALREYHAATKQRITLAWTMIEGINTRPADAQQLAELTRGLPVKLDLIDVNDATGQFLPPTPATLAAFRDALRQHLAAPVARRYSGGRDIHAACGMLSTAKPAAP
ncbi:MAG: 23S rRNA (adenine(2503)-C(2))-methyltransferase RlmN [Kiritimatiellia bacterium]